MKRWAILMALSIGGPAGGSREFEFHYDFVLGTSLDLWVRAPDRDAAEACEGAILDEIDRLNAILSTWDPSTEISRLNATRSEVRCSPELFDVLRQCEDWREKTGGAFNPYLGKIIDSWSRAAKAGEVPDKKLLDELVAQLKRPALVLDADRRTVRRLDDRPLRVDALAKGYIIGRALAAGRAKAPSVAGALLDIGGDLLASGDVPWTVGISDPSHGEDNARPIQSIRVRNRAVATSGGTERYYRIGGRSYSHIFDPRTGRPVEGILSATAVAPEAATADALATILCVLKPDESLALIAQVPGAECLIIDAEGKITASPGWAALKLQDDGSVKKASAWPDKYQMSIDITLKNQGRRVYRPYTAFWILDQDGKVVRTIAVWGNERKYLRSLTEWWAFAKDLPDVVKATTKASRGPGKYTLVWDGLDDKGDPVPQGTYTLRVEVNRDKGSHIKGLSCKMDCLDKPSKGSIDPNAEIDALKVAYGSKP